MKIIKICYSILIVMIGYFFCALMLEIHSGWEKEEQEYIEYALVSGQVIDISSACLEFGEKGPVSYALFLRDVEISRGVSLTGSCFF